MRDLVLGGIATHKFSRLLALGSVTSPVRAPVTAVSDFLQHGYARLRG